MAALIPAQAVSPELREMLKNIKLQIAGENKKKEMDIRKLDIYLNTMVLQFQKKLKRIKERIGDLDKTLQNLQE